MTDENTVKALNLLSDSSVAKFFAGLSDMGDAMPVADSLLRDLQDPEVAKAIENLPETLEKIAKIQKVVKSNPSVGLGVNKAMFSTKKQPMAMVIQNQKFVSVNFKRPI